MKPFDVYPLFDITPVKAEGSYIWDENNVKYLDLYGGHAVISIGHRHPHYLQKISTQLHRIGFYSNSVKIPLQDELAQKLGELSGYRDYNLFLCNSGAEANENAFKLASFHTGRKKVVAFKKSFHGRTSAAVAATDDKSIVAPVNETENVLFCEWNNKQQIEQLLSAKDVAAVIIEGIQGVGGVNVPDPDFMEETARVCKQHGTLLILDEIQSGYGRSGRFFAHQHTGVKPDLITVAKGMGNGFPVAGVLIHPDIKAKHGLLGTTFGGAYLACAAAVAVLDVIKHENLVDKAYHMGDYLVEQLAGIPGVREIRGKGLMIGIELEMSCAQVRKELLEKHKIFTGSSSNKNTLRILPSLTVSKDELNVLVRAFTEVMTSLYKQKAVA